MSTSYMLTLSDYIVVGATLILSSGVGIYHGLHSMRTKNKNQYHQDDDPHQSELPDPMPPATTDDDDGGRAEGIVDYFLASRTMTLIPVAVSFFATSCSTLSVIGPAMEVYSFGLSFVWWSISNVPAGILVTEIFIPLFYNIRSISIYKFLEVRYNRRMKEVITLIVALRSATVGSVIIYSTSVAFNQVTNIHLWAFVGTIAGVCVIYTTVGGIKGVMWVDVFQAFLMISCMVVLIVVGTYHVGGVTNVWNSNYVTGRLDIFSFDLNPTTRHTFWSNFVGLSFYQVSYIVTSQANIHRFLTAPTLKVAKRSSYLGFVMMSVLLFISMLIGCVMYSVFYRCDPLTAKSVQSMNQLVPKFVADVLGPYPILPGLFFAGLLSACLSTMSSIFNSVAAILMETFIQPNFPKMTAKHAIHASRFLGTGILVGLLSTVSIAFAQSFPNATQAAISTSSALEGPLLGVIVIGIFAPQAKFKVVLTAFIGGIFFTLWIVVGGLVVKQPLKMKPMFTDGCPTDNVTISFIGSEDYYANISRTSVYSTSMDSNTDVLEADSPWVKYFPLHGVTYQWVSMAGILSFTLFCGILSTIFGADEKSHLRFDPMNFIPAKVQLFQQAFPKTLRRLFLCDVYDEHSQQEKGHPQLELNNDYVKSSSGTGNNNDITITAIT